MKRLQFLLEKAADWVADGKFLDGYFLEEYNITADECRDLWAYLALLLELHSKVMKNKLKSQSGGKKK